MKIRVIARIKNDNFYSARKELGLTFELLAKKSGISICSLESYENFKNFPKSPEMIFRLEEALCKKADELFPEQYKQLVRKKIINKVEFVRSLRTLPSLQELLLLPSPDDPYQSYLTTELKDKINRAIESLDEREAIILKKYFGLADGKESNLREISQEYKVCRGRVQQIKAKALRKLRYRSKELRFLYEKL